MHYLVEVKSFQDVGALVVSSFTPTDPSLAREFLITKVFAYTVIFTVYHHLTELRDERNFQYSLLNGAIAAASINLVKYKLHTSDHLQSMDINLKILSSCTIPLFLQLCFMSLAARVTNKDINLKRAMMNRTAMFASLIVAAFFFQTMGIIDTNDK